MSRRRFLAQTLALLSAPFTSLGQGVAWRNVKAQPRGKASGIPFRARFVDVAKEAGLTHPVICGDPVKKDYIVETVGCGCAVLDYDNDGWMDLLVLNGSRFGAAPAGASNRLYRNNRDGTFTDVTAKAGLEKNVWASSVCTGDFNNDGFYDLFITHWCRFILYRNNVDGTFIYVTQASG